MKFINYLIIILAIFSCNNSSVKETNTKKVIKEWLGKEIIFPSTLSSKIIHNDTNCSELLNKKYKIIMYTDSYGCSECKLKLSHWMQFINDTKKHQDSLSFIIIVDSPNKRQIPIICEQHHFDYPIFYDNHGKMNNLNQFIPDEKFRCFLTNSNHIVAIGNPITNPKIKELYLKVITGDTLAKKQVPQTTAEYEATVCDLGKFTPKEKREAVFSLKNTGTQPLLVADVVTSCGCATPRYDKKPVKPGETMKITVEMKIKEEGYFEKTISVYCNTQNAPIQFKVKGMITNEK